MGRKYCKVRVRSTDKSLAGLIAFIDSGSDLSIISHKIAKKLGIRLQNIEMKWTASDGDVRHSPITKIELQAEDDKDWFQLNEVLVDDTPIDKESGEQVILG